MTTPPAAAGHRLYEVRHRTRYTYDEEVTASYGRAYLRPRDGSGQRCLAFRAEVTPAPAAVRESTDVYGNRSLYVEVHTAHTVLDVVATSTVEVSRPRVDLSALDRWTWEEAVALVPRAAVSSAPGAPSFVPTGAATTPGHEPGRHDPGEDDVLLAREMLLASPQVRRDPQVALYARSVFTPGRPLGDALAALVGTIHADFTYRSGATSVSTTLAEVLTRREGVCQDFAQLAVGCLRSVGLPARYVSGYLETVPPPGTAKLQGADASHAWLAVLVPELGWVDLDPTNDQVADDRYVVTAWGRDYTDVPPLKGVIFTEATTSSLDVEVDVVRLDA